MARVRRRLFWGDTTSSARPVTRRTGGARPVTSGPTSSWGFRSSWIEAPLRAASVPQHAPRSGEGAIVGPEVRTRENSGDQKMSVNPADPRAHQIAVLDEGEHFLV